MFSPLSLIMLQHGAPVRQRTLRLLKSEKLEHKEAKTARLTLSLDAVIVHRVAKLCCRNLLLSCQF